MTQTLLDNVNVDTDGEPFQGAGGSWIATVRADDYGSGTVDLEISPNSQSSFTPLTDGSFTENGQVKIDFLPKGTSIRARLSGSTSPSNVSVEINQ